VDIAPVNTKAAFIAVNDTVTAQTPLMELSDAKNRVWIKQTARNAEIAGYTNFGAGLEGALDLLEPSSASDKYIFFVADFLEAGFMFRNGKYDNVNNDMAALTKRLADSGIKVIMLFIRKPTMNQEFVGLWYDLAVKTDGDFISIDNPATLPITVESCYFREFTYNRSVTYGINASDIVQDIPIRLPAFGLDRVRIYVSSDAPPSGMQARADGVQLTFSETYAGSYYLIDLAPPLPKMVTLSLPPNGSSDVRAYLLADGGMSLTAEADSAAEEAAGGYRQKATVKLTPLGDFAPLFSGPSLPDADWSLVVTSPDGQNAEVNADYINGLLTYDFYPNAFGAYTFSLSIESQGITLSAEAEAAVLEIELPIVEPPPPEPPEPYDYSLWIAIGIGILLILVAIILARQRHDRNIKGEPIPTPLAPPAPTSKKAHPAPDVFTGKLDIYGVLVEGGKAEIPAMSVRLETFAKSKSVTFDTILK
jgi:hypothetical protein